MPAPVVAAKFIADVGGFVGGVGQALKSLDLIGASMRKIGTQSLKLSGAITGLGIVAVTQFAQFENRMAFVGAIAGATGKDFDALNEKAKSLGASTLFTARQAAEGMEVLAKAGFTTNEILGATPDVLNLATAAELELADAADIAIGIMRGFGKTAEELGNANDVLVKTFTSSNVVLGDLGETFKIVGPVAKAAGITFEELAAVTGILGDAGIKGSLAGTQLRRGILAFAAPTPKATSALKRLGVEVLNSQGKMKSLGTIIGDLKSAGADLGDLKDIVGIRAAAGFARLLSVGGGAIDAFTEKLENVGAETDRLAKVKLATLSGQFTILKSKLEAVSLDIGQRLNPVARELVAMMQRVLDGVLKVDDAMKNKILRIALLTAAISGITGILLIVAGALLSFAGIASTVVLAIVIAFGPLIAIILGVSIIAVEMKRAWDENLGGMQEKTKFVINGIKSLFADLKEAIRTAIAFWGKFFEIAFAKVEKFVKKTLAKLGIFKTKLPGALAGVGAGIGAGAQFGSQGPKVGAGGVVKAEVKAALVRIGDDFKIIFKGVFKTLAKILPPGAVGLLKKAKKEFDAMLGSLGKAGAAAASPDLDKFLVALPDGIRVGGVAVDTLIDKLRDLWRSMQETGERIKRIFQKIGLADKLKGAIGGLAGGVLKSGIAGAKTAGAQGAIVNMIATLLLASKTFKDMLQIVNTHLQFVADMLGAFLEPLRPLVAITGMLFRAMLLVSPGLILLGLVLDLLMPIFKAVFSVMRLFGLGILKIVRFLFKLIGKSTRKIDDAIEELENTTFETAGTLDDLGDAANAASEALFNVPAGVKVAAKRFAATDPDQRGPGGGGPFMGGLPEVEVNLLRAIKRAGKFTDDDDRGIGSSLGAATSEDEGGRSIEFHFHGSPKENAEEVEKILDRKGFLQSGTPTSAGKFTTSRGDR